MNTIERRRYEMLVRVKGFGAAHGSLFNESSRGAKAFAAVDAAVTQLSVHAVAKASAKRDGTDTKAAARAALVERLEAISRTARAIAKTEPGFVNKFRVPARRPDSALVTTGRLFAKEAEPYVSQFVARELPATFVADLNGLVDAFEQAIDGRNDGQDEHTAARESIDAALEAGMAAVQELDAILRNRLRDDRVTLAVWRRDRRVDYGRRRKAVTPPVDTADAREAVDKVA